MIFILCLIIIIFLHEMGHLISAKLVGCGVDVFSIGFGKPLYRKEIGKTIYQIAPILLGGYCKVEGETIASNSPNAFSNLKYRHKVIMITAGCAVNIITGLIALGLIKLGIYNYPLFLFGYLSVWLGITNLIPFPALDGSYPILVWLEKFKGKEKGYEIMNKIVRVGFVVLMTLNVVSMVILAWLYRIAIFNYFNNIICFILNLLMKVIAFIAINGLK